MVEVTADNFFGSMGNMFGLDKLSGFGFGSVGTFLLFLFGSIFMVGIIGGVIGFFYYRNLYKFKFTIVGKVGNSVMKRITGRARYIPVGKVGDKLFYIGKLRRNLPPPIIQCGINEFLFYEREDGELLNVGYEDLDKTMKELGLKFVDTDMRMQRLGIEKLLAFRLQDKGFWEKYGQMIVNALFYVLLTVLIIVIFYQLGKITDSLNVAITNAGELMAKANNEKSPNVPSTPIGVLPALIFLMLNPNKRGRIKCIK